MTRDVLKIKLKSVGKGALMAGAGAGVIAILQYVQGLNFGEYTPVAVALTSIFINTARVFFSVPAPHHEQ